MDLAEGAELLIYLEGAFFEAKERILGERFAFFADVLPFRSVFAVAILSYHDGDEFLLLFPRFQFFGYFFTLRFFHTLPHSDQFACAN